MKSVKPERLVFYTTAGLEVEFDPISPITLEESEKGLEAEYRARGEPLEPPTYETILAGGGTQTFTHDATTLESEEDKAAWQAYKDATGKLAAEQAQLRLEMVLSALKVKLPEDTAWERKLKRWHITVPEDPDAKWMFYVQREILKTPSDIFEAMTQIIGASMRGSVSEEAIEAASATFRSSVQEAAREAGVEPKADSGNVIQQSGQPGDVGA